MGPPQSEAKVSRFSSALLSSSPGTLGAAWPCLAWTSAAHPPGPWSGLWLLSQPAPHAPLPQPAGFPDCHAEGTDLINTGSDPCRKVNSAGLKVSYICTCALTASISLCRRLIRRLTSATSPFITRSSSPY